MSSADDIVILTSTPNEMEAALLVSRLEDAGVDAWTEGGLAAGFRAEAPGNANVLVRRGDVERVRELLELPAPPAPSHPPTTADDIGRRPSFGWFLIVLGMIAFVLWIALR